MYESAAPISGRLFLFSDSRDVKRLWSAEIHLRFQVAREFYTQLCLATRTSKGARRVVSTGLAACGWLRGTSRTSPGPPRRWRRPVRLRSTPARGRGFAAYLPGCARQLLTVRYAHYAGGASLTTFGFVTIVPRYLLPQVIPSHSFAALTALVVRRVNGLAALFMYRISGLAALFVRRVNGVFALLHAAPMVIQPYPSTRFRGFCAAKNSKPYPAPAPCRSGVPGAKRPGPPEAGGRSGKSG